MSFKVVNTILLLLRNAQRDTVITYNKKFKETKPDAFAVCEMTFIILKLQIGAQKYYNFDVFTHIL